MNEFLPAPEEGREALDVLRSAGLVIEPVSLSPEALSAQGFQPMPQDVFARVSGMLQPAAGLLASQAAQNASAAAYAGAYRLLIPKELAGMPRMEVKKLIDQFGSGAESMIFQGPGGKIAGHGGVAKIDAPNFQPLNILHFAFSAAAVVTNQYFLCRIDAKLSAIQGEVSKVLQFLQRKDRNQLRANLETLLAYYPKLNTLSSGSLVQLLPAITEIQTVRREALALLYDYQEESQTLQSSKKKDQDWRLSEQTKLQIYFYALYTYELAVLEELLLTQSTDSVSLQAARQRLAELTAAFRSIYQQKQSELGLPGAPCHYIDVDSNRIGVRWPWPDYLDAPVKGLEQLDRQLNGPIELAVLGGQLYARYLEGAAPGPEDRR